MDSLFTVCLPCPSCDFANHASDRRRHQLCFPLTIENVCCSYHRLIVIMSANRIKEDREQELKFLKQEEQFLLKMIAGVDKRLNQLDVESMTINRQMRESTSCLMVLLSC